MIRKVYSVEIYARILGMESVDGSAYLYISEEGLIAPIPDEWQLPKTPVERLTLRTPRPASHFGAP